MSKVHISSDCTVNSHVVLSDSFRNIFPIAVYASIDTLEYNNIMFCGTVSILKNTDYDILIHADIHGSCSVCV